MTVLLIIAAATLGTAAVALSLRNLIHASLLLIASWAGIAAFYLWAGAEFVAFAQVLVYVGAVSMVVLFAVLLTRRSRDELAVTVDSARRAFAGVLAGIVAFAVLAYAVVNTRFAASATAPAPTTVRVLGEELMGPQVGAVLVVGIILTVALLGAVVLAATDRPGGEPPKDRR